MMSRETKYIRDPMNHLGMKIPQKFILGGMMANQTLQKKLKLDITIETNTDRREKKDLNL